MSKWRRSLALVVVGLAMAGFGNRVMAQNAGGQGGQGGQGGGQGRQRGQGGPGGRGNFDPQQFRQMQLDRLKEQLAVADDEWKVLQPKIEKILDAQREARGGFFGGGGRGRGGPGGGGPGGFGPGGGNQADQTVTGRAAQALQTALQDTNTSPQQIAQLITAYRQARDVARQRLADAQKDLKELLTPRQEAVLLTNNILE